jgi:AraC-like DNA-binding protein
MTKSYRPWLSRELDYLAAHAGRVAVAVLARHLGRSRASVAGALVEHGLSRPRTPRHRWEGLLRTLHARGYSDARLARRMGCSRSTAGRRRESLGLPPNPWRGREARARYRRQMDAADATHLVDLRWRPVRVAALLGEGAG